MVAHSLKENFFPVPIHSAGMKIGSEQSISRIGSGWAGMVKKMKIVGETACVLSITLLANTCVAGIQ